MELAAQRGFQRDVRNIHSFKPVGHGMVVRPRIVNNKTELLDRLVDY